MSAYFYVAADRERPLSALASLDPHATSMPLSPLKALDRACLPERQDALALALELSGELVLFADPQTGRITGHNRAAAAQLGLTSRQLCAQTLGELLPAVADGALAQPGNRQQPLETVCRRQDGTLLPVSLVQTTLANLRVVVLRDRTQRVELEQLTAQVGHDSLTAIPSRTALDGWLEQAMRRARHENHRFAVLFVDVDNFKQVNDTWGHAVGDEVLRAVARRLSESLRRDDRVLRFGGDEFVVLIEGLRGDEEVDALAERMRRRLARPVETGSLSLSISASVGIAAYCDEYESAEDLLRSADWAMYQAKALGRDRSFTARGPVADDLPTAAARSQNASLAPSSSSCGTA